MDSISDLEFGRAAEHLVVADLILSGHRAYLTEQGLPYDIVIDRNGRLLRVQVKASRGAKRLPGRAVGMGYLYHVRRAGKRGKRQYASSEFDIIALVAMDVRVIAYLPLSDRVLQTIYLRPPGYQHHARAERRHAIDQFPIEAALAALTGTAPVLPHWPRTVHVQHQGVLFEVA